jgi:hypothetical protein
VGKTLKNAYKNYLNRERLFDCLYNEVRLYCDEIGDIYINLHDIVDMMGAIGNSNKKYSSRSVDIMSNCDSVRVEGCIYVKVVHFSNWLRDNDFLDTEEYFLLDCNLLTYCLSTQVSIESLAKLGYSEG